MPAPRHVRKKLAEPKKKELRDTLIANAEKRLPKEKAAIYARQKDGEEHEK